MTRRITVAEVQEAYRRTGLKPIRNITRDVRNGVQCGCALGALKLAEGVNIDDLDWGARTFGSPYLGAFMDGFDGRREFPGDDPIGHQDGRAVATAIFGEPTNA